MKKKINLSLKKKVISDLQAKQIVGGNDSTSALWALFTCTSPKNCARESWDVECFESKGIEDMENATRIQ